MFVVGGLIVGNPTTRRESIEANLAFARRYVDWPYIQHPTPYPGTPMTKDFRERKLIVNERVEEYDGTTRRSAHEAWARPTWIPCATRKSRRRERGCVPEPRCLQNRIQALQTPGGSPDDHVAWFVERERPPLVVSCADPSSAARLVYPIHMKRTNLCFVKIFGALGTRRPSSGRSGLATA